MSRVLLLLPTAAYRATDFLDAAAALGVEVVVASERRQALAGVDGRPGVARDLAARRPLPQAIVALAERTPLDAVVAVDDQGVLVAALAAERLGLPHNPPDAVAAARDKAAMRRAFAAAGVPQPEFRIAGPRPTSPPRRRGRLPVRGQAGVAVGEPGRHPRRRPAAAAAAAARIREILREAGEDPDGPLLVERFVPGVEVAVEGLLRGGALEVLAVFDKPDPLDGPYFEETIYVTPSRLPAATLETIDPPDRRGRRRPRPREGPVHAELRIDGTRAWLLELAARSIGGLCSRSLRFGLGVSLEELILRHALGLPLDGLAREAAASGVMMLPIPGQECSRTCAGRTRPWRCPGWPGSRSRSRAAGRCGRCPRATATSASSSPAARRPTRSSKRCVPPTVVSRS